MTKLNAIVVFFILLSGCKEDTQKINPSIAPLRPIDKLQLSDLNGNPVSLKQYKGKSIFINFWATWCKPCIREMSSIKEAQKILQNKNIVFLMVSNESTNDIQEFLQSNDYKFNYVRIENPEEMNIQALPTTFIFNNKGTIAFSETGVREWNDKTNIDLILKIINQ